MTDIRALFAALAAAGLAACGQPQAANAAPGKAEAIATATAAATARPSPSADTARIWVVGLYKGYEDDQYSPFASPENWFAPELLKELLDDEKLTPAGEMGLIDADPICSCQDPTGMQAEVTEAVMTGPATARVKLKLQWPLPPDPIPEQIPDYTRQVTLQLAVVNGAWRVSDIGEAGDEDSFLRYLRKGNGERRAGRPAR